MNYKHLTDKLEGLTSTQRLKIIWGWVKQDAIDYKTFLYLIAYVSGETH